jgi:hypothetical protein
VLCWPPLTERGLFLQRFETIVVDHVNVVDGLSNTPALDMSVVVTNGKSRASTSRGDPYRTVATLDLEGKWLVQGYVDAMCTSQKKHNECLRRL